MKLTIARSALLAALTPAAQITNRRSPSPFGSCVSLNADRSGLTARSTNSTTNVRALAPADIHKPGAVLVPAEELLRRVESMPDGPVSVTASKDKITLSAGTRVHNLRTISAENYPAFPAVPSDTLDLPASALRSVLAAVDYAQGEDISMPAFCGVVLAANDVSLTATASDSKRIARTTLAGAFSPIETFVPSSAVRVIVDSLAGAETATIATTDAAVYIQIGDVEIVYQRPGVTAPPYDALMPRLKGTDGPAVDRRDLLARIRGVTVDGVGGNVPVVLKCAAGSLTITHTAFDGEPSVDEMALSDDGWKWTVAAEAKYLIDALSRLPGESVRLCVHEAEMQQPIVIRAEDGIATIARIDPGAARGQIIKKEAA